MTNQNRQSGKSASGKRNSKKRYVTYRRAPKKILFSRKRLRSLFVLLFSEV